MHSFDKMIDPHLSAKYLDLKKNHKVLELFTKPCQAVYLNSRNNIMLVYILLDRFKYVRLGEVGFCQVSMC